MAHENGVQLIVLPEDSLINTECYNRSMLINHILEPMANPQDGELVNYCLVPGKQNSVLKIISCLALKFKIFIALNFGDKVPCDHLNLDCPQDGYYLYNTLALFDQNGNLVAKYHKMHPYYEFHYNVPKTETAIVYYDSPFGRLGFMICFDLLYELPGIKLVEQFHVQTIIYSTYWFNHLPFSSSVQLQQAFAIRHQVNLLGSCVQVPKTGTLGSGIYSGIRGALVYTNIPDGQSKLAIATLPTYPRKTNSIPKSNPKLVTVFQNASVQKLENKQMNPDEFPSMMILDLNETIANSYWCPYTSHFCCRVYFRLNNSDDHVKFVLLAGSLVNGALGQPRYPIHQEYCGLVLCQDDNYGKCSKFASNTKTQFHFVVLSGTFHSDHVYPSVIANDNQLLPTKQWFYKRFMHTENIIQVWPKEPITSITLYGRYYQLDPIYHQ